jgi:hypothetical protein
MVVAASVQQLRMRITKMMRAFILAYVLALTLTVWPAAGLAAHSKYHRDPNMLKSKRKTMMMSALRNDALLFSCDGDSEDKGDELDDELEVDKSSKCSTGNGEEQASAGSAGHQDMSVYTISHKPACSPEERDLITLMQAHAHGMNIEAPYMAMSSPSELVTAWYRRERHLSKRYITCSEPVWLKGKRRGLTRLKARSIVQDAEAAIRGDLDWDESATQSLAKLLVLGPLYDLATGSTTKSAERVEALIETAHQCWRKYFDEYSTLEKATVIKPMLESSQSWHKKRARVLLRDLINTTQRSCTPDAELQDMLGRMHEVYYPGWEEDLSAAERAGELWRKYRARKCKGSLFPPRWRNFAVFSRDK